MLFSIEGPLQYIELLGKWCGRYRCVKFFHLQIRIKVVQRRKNLAKPSIIILYTEGYSKYGIIILLRNFGGKGKRLEFENRAFFHNGMREWQDKFDGRRTAEAIERRRKHYQFWDD